MARLFGLISKEEVNFNIKIEDLGKNSTGKIHGWGIGGYDKLRKIQVQKGKRSSVSIEQNSKINASLKSDIIIAHARVATTGFVKEQNVRNQLKAAGADDAYIEAYIAKAKKQGKL